jgi:hypothetical protein
MGLAALKGKPGGYDHGCVPVLIELKDFNTQEIDIAKAIYDEFHICGFPFPMEQTTLQIFDASRS